MINTKLYTCQICKTDTCQFYYHKSCYNPSKARIETQNHKDKKELFELKLSELSTKELYQLYNTIDISVIVDENETYIYTIKFKK
jgi:arsenate reductase-like glutaredoxin family protein